MSARIQKIMSFAVSFDASAAMKELARFHRALGETKQYANAHRQSIQTVRVAVDELAASVARAEAVAARLSAIQSRRAAQLSQLANAVQQPVAQASQLVNATQVSRQANAVQQPAAQIGQLANAVQQPAAQVSQLANAFGGLKSSLLGVAAPTYLAYRAFEGLKRSVQLSAELDAARARFTVFTGSVEQANRTLAELRQLSERGVSFTGGQQAITTMLQFGVTAENVVKDFKAIAEITGGDSERMNRLALAFAQTSTAGKLMAQDLNQMIQAGFNPLKVISDQTGVSLLRLKEQMSEGAISSQMVRQAFLDATREGGRFNGLLDEIAKTTAGKLTRARSEVEQFAIAFGDLLKPATDGALDAFIDDLDRLGKSMEMLSGSNLNLGSLTNLLTQNPIVETGKLPSYAVDIAAAKATVDPGTSRFAEVMKQKAEATVRLDNSRLGILISPADRKAADDYLKQLARLESLNEQIKEGKRVAATASEIANAKELEAVRQREAANKRIDNETFNRMRQEADTAAKRAASQEDARKIELDFIEKMKQLDPSRLGKAELQWAESEKKAMAERSAAMAKAQLAQDTFAKSIAKAKSDSIDARYGDKGDSVSLLLEQSVDGERKKLEALIAQGAAYSAIVAAANAEAQAQAKSLDAAQQKAKAAEDAAKKQKEDVEKTKGRAEEIRTATNESVVKNNAREWKMTFGGRDGAVLGEVYSQSGVSEQRRIETMVGAGKSFKEIMASLDAETQKQAKLFGDAFDWNKKVDNLERYKKALEDLKTKSKELEESQKPNAEFVKQMADLNLMFQKGGLGKDAYEQERSRLLNENVKNVNATAAPVIGKGSQEAYQFATGQTIDKITMQLREAEKQTLLQTSANDIAQKTQDKIDELINGKPSVAGP